MIIGIDHGFYAIKTRNCSFPAGITPFSDREPYTRQNVLALGGCFFVCGSGRQPIQRDKTANDNYYLLTLTAIAQELQARSAPREGSVTIAAGLPLTSYGREKPAFRKYLLRNVGQPTKFGYEGKTYCVTIEDVLLFPQGFTALMTQPDLLTDEPSMLPSSTWREPRNSWMMIPNRCFPLPASTCASFPRCAGSSGTVWTLCCPTGCGASRRCAP